MKRNRWPEGFGQKPNGVFKVRKVVPKELRAILKRDEFNHTFKDQYGRGLKIELDALEQYPRYWRDFNRQIDQARLGWQSSETFFENFIDEDFARGVSERPIQNPSDALSRAMKTYLTNRMVEGSYLHIFESEKARSDVGIEFDEAMYESDKLTRDFAGFLADAKVMLPDDSPMREPLFNQFKMLTKGTLGRFKAQALRVEAMNQVKAIEAIDTSQYQNVARATLKDYGQPQTKPMMRLSAWFEIYISRKSNIKGLPPDEVRALEAKGEVVEDYLKVKDMEVRQKHENALEALIDVIGDKPLNRITRHDAISFVEMLNDLPVSMKPEVKAMTFSKRVAWSRENPEIPKATTATIEKWVGRIKAVWRKALLTYRHEFTDLYQIWDDMDEFIAGRKSQKKRPFKPREITSIFNTPMFMGFAGDADKAGYRNKKGETLAQDHNWWLFVLCAYHGNRLSEYARRSVDDLLRDEDGVLYLKIEEAKNDGSVRRLPIHQFCIDLGFEHYVEKVKAAGHNQMFPQLADVSETREQADHFSQWAGRWFRENGFDFDDPIDGKATFACWRHTFSTVATATDGPDAACLSESQAGHITGHAQGDVQKRVYIQPSNATMKANLDKVWLPGFPYDKMTAIYAGGRHNRL